MLRILIRSIPRQSRQRAPEQKTGAGAEKTGRKQNAVTNRAELGQERAGARPGGSNAAFMPPASRGAEKQFLADLQAGDSAGRAR